MDKVRLPDRRKPPKQARFPDALGRAKTDSSKLVAGAGVSGSSPLVGSPYCAASRERPMLILRAAKKQPDVPLALRTMLWQRAPHRAGTCASPRFIAHTAAGR